MVISQNKVVVPGFAGQKEMDFYTIRSSVQIGSGDASLAPQQRLNKIIEVISQRAQPLITEVSTSTETNPADLPAATGSVTVYTIKLALDTKGAWANATPGLLASFEGVGSGVTGDSVVFVTNPSTANIAITLHADLN